MGNPIVKIKHVILGVLYALLAHLHLNKTDFGETKYSNNALKESTTNCQLQNTREVVSDIDI